MSRGPLRFLALGDSYTIGEGVAAGDRWPNRLASRLRRSGADLSDPEIIAETGWTTADLDAALDDATLAPPYSLVTLMIGVNDQYDGVPLGTFRQRFRGLLERAVEYAGRDRRRVVVVSIPDWTVTPFAADRDRDALAAEVWGFNAAVRAETVGGAGYVDVTPLSRAQGALVGADGLHPTAGVYAAWADRIAPAAQRALGL